MENQNKIIQEFNNPLSYSGSKLLTTDDLILGKNEDAILVKTQVLEWLLDKKLSNYKLDRVINATNNLVSLINED